MSMRILMQMHMLMKMTRLERLRHLRCVWFSPLRLRIAGDVESRVPPRQQLVPRCPPSYESANNILIAAPRALVEPAPTGRSGCLCLLHVCSARLLVGIAACCDCCVLPRGPLALLRPSWCWKSFDCTSPLSSSSHEWVHRACVASSLWWRITDDLPWGYARACWSGFR